MSILLIKDSSVLYHRQGWPVNIFIFSENFFLLPHGTLNVKLKEFSDYL